MADPGFEWSLGKSHGNVSSYLQLNWRTIDLTVSMLQLLQQSPGRCPRSPGPGPATDHNFALQHKAWVLFVYACYLLGVQGDPMTFEVLNNHGCGCWWELQFSSSCSSVRRRPCRGFWILTSALAVTRGNSYNRHHCVCFLYTCCCWWWWSANTANCPCWVSWTCNINAFIWSSCPCRHGLSFDIPISQNRAVRLVRGHYWHHW